MARTDEYQTDDSDLFSLDISQHGNRTLTRQRTESLPVLPEERLQKLLTVITDQSDFEKKLRQDVGRLKPIQGVACREDCAVLARDLRSLGYVIREHGPGTGNPCQRKSRFCLETLNHNYLTCLGSANVHCQEELIVEPYFREEFHIANPTHSYTVLISLLPAEFVGTTAKMTLVVEIMSQAIAEAFIAQGMTLPPWRRTTAVLSKWGLEIPDDTAHGQSKAKRYKETQEPEKATELEAQDIPEMPVKDQNPVSPKKINPVKRISLLARNLADCAAINRGPQKKEPVRKNDKLKRNISWDFSALQPITTVRRTGRAR